MGTIASTCLYNTAKTASNFWTLSDITRYQVVPKKMLLFFFLNVFQHLKKKKRQYSIYCFYGASRREQEVKRILIGTTHKSLYKNENRNTTKQKNKKKQFSSGSHLCSVSNFKSKKKKKLNKDDIYRERNGSLFLFNLFTCFNVASTCYKRAELKISQRNKKYPKLLFFFFFF